eukprot:6702367-Prymnesium_polylepis.1
MKSGVQPWIGCGLNAGCEPAGEPSSLRSVSMPDASRPLRRTARRSVRHTVPALLPCRARQPRARVRGGTWTGGAASGLARGARSREDSHARGVCARRVGQRHERAGVGARAKGARVRRLCEDDVDVGTRGLDRLARAVEGAARAVARHPVVELLALEGRQDLRAGRRLRAVRGAARRPGGRASHSGRGCASACTYAFRLVLVVTAVGLAWGG